ncbi:hypothetical protein F9U64_00550 [Gracilibacillus oryzae]|uniref:Uncharacterized protein n=1 Tax=Gracilibacillus oryzae TaxID=1672701 RepID=A0A7C8L9V8_9BACI|nr:glycosyl hydrolase [Gracilibacillus oryzae]KAB8139316.1 hypothetical protein F9U64_00550 [Gracilibacillus oryzae]
MDSLYQQFLNPASEFSPMPFWFWNDQLDKETLRSQIEDFQQKGVEGFVLHPRIGIPKDTEYLSTEFMEYVKFAVKEAHQRNMHVILYDEAMYPSGAANGKVVQKNRKYASRGLYAQVINDLDQPVSLSLEEDDRIVAIYLAEKQDDKTYIPEQISCLYPLNAQIIEVSDNTVFITKEVIDQYFQVKQRDKENYECIVLIEKYTYGTIRGIHADQDDGQSEAPRSADLLNPEAVNTFIGLTHESYKEAVGDYFGNTIFAMFTDEPDITGRNARKGGIAWTNQFERFLYQKGLHIEDLPGLFFSVGEKTDRLRKLYEKALNKRMLETYYVPISEWCEKNHLYLTGHPAKSDDIGLLHPFTIPGQDVVWRWVAPEDEKGLAGQHATAGKCGADAARHFNRRRNLNEYLGVCGKDNGWNLSASDMKWYTDWLAVRGVNLFCPHAFYYSVEGRERSHERPPDVGPNNVWWQYYHYFSTYIKRVSWLMTDSVNQADIAVLAQDSHLPWKMAKYFHQNQIEFNYLHESLFSMDKVTINGDQLSIGKQIYHAFVIDNMDLADFHPKVEQIIQQFAANGGKVYLVTGNDEKKINNATCLSPEEETEMNEHFLPYRYFEITESASDLRITKLKKSGKQFYFMTNEGETSCQRKVKLKEPFPVEEWNPWTGTRRRLTKNDQGEYLLELSSRESRIWYTEAGINSENQQEELIKVAELDLNVQPSAENDYWNKNSLSDWSELEDLCHFSGSLDYQFNFNYQGPELDEVVIDLGEVYEIAEVIWSEESNVKMWAPYRVTISGEKVQKGENSFIVRITNNSANKMDKQLLPSGLIGPVRLFGYQKKMKRNGQ